MSDGRALIHGRLMNKNVHCPIETLLRVLAWDGIFEGCFNRKVSRYLRQTVSAKELFTEFGRWPLILSAV